MVKIARHQRTTKCVSESPSEYQRQFMGKHISLGQANAPQLAIGPLPPATGFRQRKHRGEKLKQFKCHFYGIGRTEGNCDNCHL